MDFGRLQGYHVVILMFAVLLLSVPLAAQVSRLLAPEILGERVIGRSMPFILASVAILAIGPLRRRVAAALSAPLTSRQLPATLAGYALALLHAFAWMAAYVLWFHWLEGPTQVEQRLASAGSASDALADALSRDGLVVGVLLAGVVGPVIEELVFRGLLFRLWAARWGWFAAMLMTSVLFGLYHANFLPAFVGGLIYVAIYQATGTLRASILAHGAFNVSTVYPLLGQFIFPRDLVAPGDPSSWTLHIVLMCVLLVALPIFIWTSRPREDANLDLAPDHVPLPR